ncbi:MAG: tRNA (adenosine(37)-N6)-dimethylallyltransferase MiaA, partial [Tenericutes bacterium]|nr:tRNA (adenosine(37)-N6)-dimethylallyltransferase MiaA [Mycoplasmatota bacterium]
MILAIVGPTGVGKTKLSINLAKKYNADIISCDSMQIYRKMDIGTSKVTEDEKENVKHYMLDIRDANEDYSVYDYQKEARKILNDKLKNNKNVIIVGGTGLYLKALLYNYEFTENNNPKKDFSKYTNEELYNMVLKIDKETKIHVNNRQRLESFLNNHDKKYKVSNKMLYDAKIIGLTRPRDELYDAINKRVDKMMEEGLEKEARYFYDNNINSKAINTAIAY